MRTFALFGLGVREEMDAEVRRVITLSNILYVIIASLLIFYIVLSFPTYLRGGRLSLIGWVPFIILAISLICLWLNRAKHYKLSKVLFMSTWILFVTVIPIALLGTKRQDYIMHPFYCIISSVMVHLLFSYYRERFAYIFFLAVVWLLILFSVDLITYFLIPESNSTLFQHGFFNWRLITFMFAAFFNGTMMYVLQINHRFYRALQSRNETITTQNRALEQQSRSLEELMTQLEAKVASRTHSLAEQNKKLTEYVYFNSHILRAAVSRIRGLINLLTMKIEEEEEMKVRSMLTASMSELDQAIKSINEKLLEEETRQ